MRFSWIMLTLAFDVFYNASSSFLYSQLKEPIMFEMRLSHAEAFLFFNVHICSFYVTNFIGMFIDLSGFKLSCRLALLIMDAFDMLRSFVFDYGSMLLFQLFNLRI